MASRVCQNNFKNYLAKKFLVSLSKKFYLGSIIQQTNITFKILENLNSSPNKKSLLFQNSQRREALCLQNRNLLQNLHARFIPTRPHVLPLLNKTIHLQSMQSKLRHRCPSIPESHATGASNADSREGAGTIAEDGTGDGYESGDG